MADHTGMKRLTRMVLDRHLLVRMLGFPATLIHGDLLIWDRWRWVKRRLPRTQNGETLLDVGCGSGALTIGAALRGYRAVGLSWDEDNQAKAKERAGLCGVDCSFPVLDVRHLGEAQAHKGAYDVALCLENVEHICDDRKLIRDIADCLKPGGLLLLTTPNYFYRPISKEDLGPFSAEETGAHVRRGYSASGLRELCDEAGLDVEEIGSCSGFFSQKGTALLRRSIKLSPVAGWALVLPLRVLPPIADRIIRRVTGWPDFCIALVACKPRWKGAPCRTDTDRIDS
jgi:2-polyprenyl-3-methyl-5-hydroxy-6-metoxy-1,4-benzoquinol methylase